MQAFDAEKKEFQSQSTSEKMWNFRWPSILEHYQDIQITLRRSSFREAMAFINDNQKRLLTQNERESRFLFTTNSKEKEYFYKNHADFFAFYNNRSEIVGVFIANATDWQTYYFRYINVDPSMRGHKLCERSCKSIINFLKNKKTKRIELDVSPSNIRQVSRLSQMGFNIIGNSLSEIWGATIKMTYFIDQTHLNSFIDNLKIIM